MLTPDAADRVAARIAWLGAVRERVVIDGDVHPTDPAAIPPDMAARMAADPGYFHGRPISGEEVIAALDRAGVDMALCWQNPSVTRYGADEARNAEALLAANAAIAALAAQWPQRIIPAGWTDPKALGVARAIALAETCIDRFGMSVVKMNPAQNAYPIDSQMVFDVVDAIVARGAVPAFHFGADTGYTPAEGLGRVAARHPGHPVIGVHMGGGGGHFVESEETYQKARRLGLEQPNVFYILSAKRDVHVRSALVAYAAAGAPFSANLACASDAPYGDIVWNFGGYRALFEALANGDTDPRLAARPGLFDASMVAGFLGRNLADLVIAADRRLLAAS